VIERLKLNPVLCAAVGAAIGFYFLGASSQRAGLLFAVLLALVSAICFLRVLSSLDLQSRSLRLAAAYSIAFSAGIVLGVSASAQIQGVHFGVPPGTVTAVKGQLLDDPRGVSGGRAMAALSLAEAAGAAGARAGAAGELTVFFPQGGAPSLREFGRGTVVFAEGVLRESGAGGGVVFFAESLYIVTPASSLQAFRTGIRLNLTSRFEGFAWGGLALALLIGIRDNLDSSLTASFREAGVSYLLALSGMHLAVIISIISFLLKKPLGVKAAAITGAAIIGLYCFVVGPMPSLDRSALMYLLGVFVILGALPKEPLSILGMAFMIQIAISPASGHSIAFTLSYLALLGILIVGDALGGLLAGKMPVFLCRSLAASVGAFLATAGITAHFFGVLRPVGVIVSIVLVPLITFFMVGALVWLALSFVSPFLSGLLDLPLFLLFRLMESCVYVGSASPGIAVSGYALALAVSLGFSFLIVWLGFRRQKSANRLLRFG